MTKVALIGEFHEAGKKILEENNINYFSTFDYDFENLKNCLSDCDAIGIRTAKLPAEVLSHCSKLKIVARHGVGYDSVDLNYLNTKKIPLAITGTSNAVSVAEHVITMFLSLSRRIIDCHNLVRDGEYVNKTLIQKTVELFNKKVLIIGYGRIGKEVAKRLSSFDCEILIHDPILESKNTDVSPYKFVDLETGLKNANFITIHIPLLENTKNLISKNEFSIMKNDTIIVNTSRGGIVNQEDLKLALEEEKILGAGLDVFTNEPPDSDDPILSAKNIIFTPHNAALTLECRTRMSIETIENILSHINNNTNIDNIINKNIL